MDSSINIRYPVTIPQSSSRQGRKKILFLAVIGLFVGAFAVAQALFGSVGLTANVFEPLSITSPTTITVDVFPGDVHNETVTIANRAGIDLKAVMSVVEVSNPNGVTYVSSFNPSSTILIPQKGSNSVVYSLAVPADSPSGNLTLSLNMVRNAA